MSGLSSPQAGSASCDPDFFRTVCGQFATGVTVVTTESDTGPRAATVNSFSSLTLDPPQIIVCLRNSTRTWSAIRRSGRFAVNILAADQEGLAHRFASADPDKMSEVGMSRGHSGVPVLPNTVGTLECTVSDAVAKATHVIIIGTVVHASCDSRRPPLVFFRSTMYRDVAGDDAGLRN
ncbi:flavin reductase family protein [Saccharopolyspora sp. 5N708]|uniref:flavin reductase family protein n=1 Tax=Saccharopolyspora sp. 5N708 TaxID=3457424 RepID=UPI003FD62D45